MRIDEGRSIRRLTTGIGGRLRYSKLIRRLTTGKFAPAAFETVVGLTGKSELPTGRVLEGEIGL